MDENTLGIILVSLVPLGIGVVLLFVGLHPIIWLKTYPAKSGARLGISGFRAGHGHFDLRSWTGRVERARTEEHTDVITKTYDDSARLPETRTVTTVYDQLMLVDEQGQKRGFQVADFHVVTAPGHEITIVWATRPNAKEGMHIAVLDRTTGQSFFRFQSWGLFLGPLRMLVVMGIALGLGLPLLILGGIGLALPLGAGLALRHYTKRNIETVRRLIAKPA